MWSRNRDETQADGGQDSGWERDAITRLATDALREQRARRRWGVFFKLLGFAYLITLLVLFVDWDDSDDFVDGGHTALIDLSGVISANGDASAERVIGGLQHAFKHKDTKGVILRVNSPGGSPVQSGIIHDEILRLRKEYPAIPLHAVVEDICASGGYFVAVAADRIYVNRASVIGSIGVLIDGFGFTGTMDKLGVERRLLTAGENKGFLDPFSPQDGKQKEHAQVLLNDIHQQFINVVRKGRGDRLKENPDMFSGLMWTGVRSIELGLADDYGTVEGIARDVFKAERLVDFTDKPGIGERFARRFGAGVGDSLARNFGAVGPQGLR